MASFNQSPTGQNSVALSLSAVSLVIRGEVAAINSTAPSSTLYNDTPSVDFSSTAVVAAPTGFYPTYRRPDRVITSV